MAHSWQFPLAHDMQRATLRLFAAWLAIVAPAAQAWGPAGHRIVAELAQQQLSPAARAQVAQLLGSRDPHALAGIANWADDLRNDPAGRALGKRTARLHFINFASPDCRYRATRDCPDGNCVVAAIERYARILGDPARGQAERAEALRFLVHFVGDVHQPLHASPRDDRGGNRFQLQFEGRGTNLHAIWDTPVPVRPGMGWREQAARLARQPLPDPGGTPAQWAEESCRLVRDGGIYPPRHRIDASYLAQHRPLAEQRIRQAAVRLAELLDRALG